ncbi:MAG: hypothetical protein BGO02_01305 [Brevundimonas sp. 67-6]|nr:MAG: hypothetical protein BGO02_01305 [Brevundimonas sp. 67-6]
MNEISKKSSAAEALKRALAAKKAAQQDGGFTGVDGARKAEHSMQRQAAALNKPAFRRASKRG